MKLILKNDFRILFASTIFLLLVFGFMPYANADLVGSITTNKNLYDSNETILITFNVSSDSSGVPDSAELYVEGTMPSYNGTFLRQSDYFGRKFFEGNDISNSSVAYFKHIKSFKVFDSPDTDTSSFIPIPPVRGTVNAFVKPSVSGEYVNFLGKVNIFFDNSNIVKIIHITSENPQIILTNNTMQFKSAYTTQDTLIINYFCKNNCSIEAVDEANPASPVKTFQYGITPGVTGKTLTTSDTNEWKQIIIPLALSGYTPDDDFVRVTITDIKGNKDEATFFVYQPTSDVIRLNKNVIFDVGKNVNNKVSFNNSMGLVYRTPTLNDEYRIIAVANAFSSPSDCNGAYGFRDGILYYPLKGGVVAPDNGIEFISLEEGNIYDEFNSKLSCMDSSTTNLTLNVDFKLQYKTKFLYIFPYWSVLGTTTANIHADRTDMNLKSLKLITVTEEGKTSIGLTYVADAIGMSGVLGHLIFALIFLVATFFVIVRVLKLDAKIAIIFGGFEVFYFVYAGFIDPLLIVIIIVIVAFIYTTKILKMFRNEERPPSEGEGEE